MISGPRRAIVALLMTALGASWSSGVSASSSCLRGVNVAGAEFGELPGRYGFDYAYPARATLTSLAATGINTIRLPFRWERLQPRLNAPLDSEEVERLDATVAAAKAAGLTTILDLHNYGYFNKTRIDASDLGVAAFTDVWGRLAKHYLRESSVAFGLMNEPYDLPATVWLKFANAAIDSIRKAGARQLILVPGTAYSGAHSWTADLPVGNNGATMSGVVDPGNHFAFEFHQYLDGDYSGRAPSCDNATAALSAIARLDQWLSDHRARGFIGEIGASDQPACQAALAAILDHLNAHPKQWLGWTVWAAGERWPASYPFNVQPSSPLRAGLRLVSEKAKTRACTVSTR